MSKKYDIIERLKAANERPFICVTEDLSYEVKTTKTAVLHMAAVEKDTELNEAEKIDKIIEIMLGEKALQEINALDLSLEAMMIIVEAIGAAIGGEELDEVKERFQEAKEA